MSTQNTENTKKGINKNLLACALVFLLLAIPGMAMAYTDGGGQTGMGPEAAYQDFDDATLQSFAVASVELQGIQESYSTRLQGVQDQDKAIELQQQANDEMVSAVKNEGLDVMTYNAIANAMNNSPELNARIMGMMERARDN